MSTLTAIPSISNEKSISINHSSLGLVNFFAWLYSIWLPAVIAVAGRAVLEVGKSDL
jgi:hypothetical protein